MTILTIDTTDSTRTTVTLKKNRRLFEYNQKTNLTTKSQNILPLIQKALKAQRLQLSDLTEIKVNPGPGSFTGTRVGVAVANTLGWVLRIPVNGTKVVLPVYEKSKFDG